MTADQQSYFEGNVLVYYLYDGESFIAPPAEEPLQPEDYEYGRFLSDCM